LTLCAFSAFVVGSLARAADARLGYWWGWLYGEPEHSTSLDLFVDGVIHRLIPVQAGHSTTSHFAIDSADNDSKIRILPLEPDRR
jgi:hypothetical protein